MCVLYWYTFRLSPVHCGQVEVNADRFADRFLMLPHSADGKAERRNCLIFRAILDFVPTVCGQVDRVDRVFSMFICIFTGETDPLNHGYTRVDTD